MLSYNIVLSIHFYCIKMEYSILPKFHQVGVKLITIYNDLMFKTQISRYLDNEWLIGHYFSHSLLLSVQLNVLI